MEQMESTNNYSNLCREEWKDLKDLRNYRDVMMKRADKGSANVVRDLWRIIINKLAIN